MMQKLGWAYVVSYCLDALMSLVASFYPKVEMASNLLSMLMLSFGILILIFICMDSLRPRRVFAVMLAYNAAMLVFGVFLGVMIGLRHGPSVVGLDIDLAFYGEEFEWYWPAHWVLMTIWLGVAAYGVVAYARFRPSDAQRPV